jgi:hypothetical protein
LISKGLNVRSTTFPHKDIYKEIWYSADGRTVNQIDHVLISNRFRSAITDIRVLRGPDIGSDHNKQLKLRLKNTIIDKTTYASETRTLTKRDRGQLNIFEWKVYR